MRKLHREHSGEKNRTRDARRPAPCKIRGQVAHSLPSPREGSVGTRNAPLGPCALHRAVRSRAVSRDAETVDVVGLGSTRLTASLPLGLAPVKCRKLQLRAHVVLHNLIPPLVRQELELRERKETGSAADHGRHQRGQAKNAAFMTQTRSHTHDPPRWSAGRSVQARVRLKWTAPWRGSGDQNRNILFLGGED